MSLIHTPPSVIARCGSKEKIIEWFTAHLISFGITKTSAGGSDIHAKEVARKFLFNLERECVWDGIGGILGGGHRGPTTTGDSVRDLATYYNDHISKQSGYEVKEMHKDAWMFLPRSPGPSPYGTLRFGKSATSATSTMGRESKEVKLPRAGGAAKGSEPASPDPISVAGAVVPVVGLGIGSLLLDGLLGKSDRGEKIMGTGASHMAAIAAGAPMTGTIAAAPEMTPMTPSPTPVSTGRLPNSLRALIASRPPNVNTDTGSGGD